MHRRRHHDDTCKAKGQWASKGAFSHLKFANLRHSNREARPTAKLSHAGEILLSAARVRTGQGRRQQRRIAEPRSLSHRYCFHLHIFSWNGQNEQQHLEGMGQNYLRHIFFVVAVFDLLSPPCTSAGEPRK